MYIKYNGTDYPCICRPSKTMCYQGLPDDFPAPVSGEIILCADDGFVLRTDNTEDYLRQTFENGVLMLTNTPEPVETEPDPVPTSDRVTWDDMAAAITEGVNEV